MEATQEVAVMNKIRVQVPILMAPAVLKPDLRTRFESFLGMGMLGEKRSGGVPD